MVHDFKNFPELTDAQMPIYYFESPHKQITSDFWAEVVEVHDGDTIRVTWSERSFDFPIRFSNIAAPELAEKGGPESQSWLEDKILGEEVFIKLSPKRVGKFGRLLGRVIWRGLDIGEESVAMGQSIPFEMFQRKPSIPDFSEAIA